MNMTMSESKVMDEMFFDLRAGHKPMTRLSLRHAPTGEGGAVALPGNFNQEAK